MSNLEMLSTFKVQAILDVHNHLAAAKEQKPLASWDKAKSELVNRIAKMATGDEIEAAIKATEDGPKPGTKGKVVKTAKPAKKAAKAKTEKKAKTEGGAKRQSGVGALVREILAAEPDLPAVDVLARVHKKFPEAKTSIACVGWYRSQMYKAGDLKKAKVKALRAESAAANRG